MRKCKVLQIGCENFGSGGRSVIIYNMTKEINQKKFAIDFLSLSGKKNEVYKNEIESRGGKIVNVCCKSKSGIKYQYELIRKMIKAIKTEKYDIVHINADHAWEAAKSAIISRIAGVKHIVVHAHNTGTDSPCNMLKRIIIAVSKIYLKFNVDKRFACSYEAASFLFGEKNCRDTVILKNGISFDKFAYDKDKREKIQRELGISGNYVVISVGRLEPQKNPLFLIDVFYKLQQKKNAVLIMIGEGSLREKIEQKVSRLGIEDKVKILGNRNDVNDLLQAADVFILPSVYEGFGIVNIEAQASGLLCVVSTEIPETASVNPNFYRIPLDKGDDYWADFIFSKDSERYSKELRENFVSKGFDIKQSAQELQKHYEEII